MVEQAELVGSNGRSGVGRVSQRDQQIDSVVGQKVSALVSADIDMMRRAELMVVARKMFGVPVRRTVSKGRTLYRSVGEVKKDCKCVQAQLAKCIQRFSPIGC